MHETSFVRFCLKLTSDAISYLGVPRSTLGHSRRDSSTNPMFIIAFVQVRPDGHREPRNWVLCRFYIARLFIIRLKKRLKNLLVISAWNWNDFFEVWSFKFYGLKEKLGLTLSLPVFPSVFWWFLIFSGGSKGNIGKERVNPNFSFNP